MPFSALKLRPYDPDPIIHRNPQDDRRRLRPFEEQRLGLSDRGGCFVEREYPRRASSPRDSSAEESSFSQQRHFPRSSRCDAARVIKNIPDEKGREQMRERSQRARESFRNNLKTF